MTGDFFLLMLAVFLHKEQIVTDLRAAEPTAACLTHCSPVSFISTSSTVCKTNRQTLLASQFAQFKSLLTGDGHTCKTVKVMISFK